jgi:hypothetical protein
LAFGLALAVVVHAQAAEKAKPAALGEFLQTHCSDCHTGAEAEAGLDLTKLQDDLRDAATEGRWVRIYDRVHSGEMPPKAADQPQAADRTEFLTATSRWLVTQRRAREAVTGRVQARRLTRREIERSLQDLLGIDIPLANQLPEEKQTSGFTTVADGQAMSHFQMERHLKVVDVALEEAFRRAQSPHPDLFQRDFDAQGVAREDPERRCREPEMRNGQAVVWSSGLIYYGRIPATQAPADGWYRFRVTVSGLKRPKSGGVWTTVHSGPCVSSAPLLNYITSFEAGEEPKTIEFEAWLAEGHMLEIRPGDATLDKAKFNGGQVGVGEGERQDVPGVAIDRITMERFHRGADVEGIRRILFGQLKLERGESSDKLQPKSPQRQLALAELLTTFAGRAFRRPVTQSELAGYITLAQGQLEADAGLAAALRVGYRAILCSPRFVYFYEEPGTLDDYAIATRLSYLLTGSTPDAMLVTLAHEGRLRAPDELREQVDRLLANAGGRRFVADFAAEWLDLNLIDFTEPDRKLFPEFDGIVQNSMLAETHTFLETMLRENRPVTELIDADYTFLNSRLARFYELDQRVGDELDRVLLSPKSRRGGVLTQGAILKVTANGNNTSPVVRGIWVSERLLGVEIPPPPGGVPAIEPDIRGAKTIREQLEKHKSQESCAVCHRQIDPPGFALENYDPAGQWRDRYLQVVSGKKKSGLKIDASFALPDGREFDDIIEFKRLATSKPSQLAENVAAKLLVYGTGAPVSFADRAAVQEMAATASGNNYGFRSIVHAVVTHPVFLSK